jgi:ribose transport system permease protein
MTSLETRPEAMPSASTPTGVAARRSLFRWLSFGNIGALYVWLAIIITFAIWIPDLFLTSNTLVRIMNEYSVAAIVALALVLPLSAGVYDLSIGSVMGLTGIVAGKLLGDTGLPVLAVLVLALACGAAAGAVNALVVYLGLDSFIATLASGSIIAALTLGVSGQQILTERVSGSFSELSSRGAFRIQLPFLYALILATVIGLLLSRTVLGRRIYASGFNATAARLAGISVARMTTLALVVSGLLAGFAGVVLAARVEAADPTAGPSYLIPAFSAAFLGATQFNRGRFNPWGTLVAVFMIGTGSIGLLLAGAPQWAPQLFQGVVLIFAVGLTVIRRRERVA